MQKQYDIEKRLAAITDRFIIAYHKTQCCHAWSLKIIGKGEPFIVSADTLGECAEYAERYICGNSGLDQD